MNELQEFIELSKYAGERFDLIQAGGGNTSVKFENKMYIKASGVYLSEVEQDYGYAIVENDKILDVFNNKNILNGLDKKKKDLLSVQYISNSNLTGKFKPSIETLLHSILKKYTLHSHPIVVNAIACRKDWKEIFTSIFNDEVILVNYKTPGIELAFELKKEIENKDQKIIILQNHGLIVTSDSKDDVIEQTEYVIDTISKYLDVDMSNYKLTNEVSSFINAISDEKYISYISNDKYLIENINSSFINSKPFCPDKMVYCGVNTLILDSEPINLIKEYKKLYFSIPNVLLYKNNLFLIAKNTKKAKEIEEVFRFHIMSLNLAKYNNINYLDDSEIEYLANWEAEKYRQNLK